MGKLLILSIGLFILPTAQSSTLLVDRDRAARLLDWACQDLDETFVHQAFAGVTVERREILSRGEIVFGWRQRLSFDSGEAIAVERIAPQQQLRRLSIEFFDRQSKPSRLLIADGACDTRQLRAIRYEGSSASALQILDSQWNLAEPEIPMNPPVPDGADPGGVTVAIVDSGVNYLLPVIGDRLARDSGGQVVGFDFWDMDERPFDSHPSRSIFFPQRHGTRVAGIIAREAPQARLIPYRYPRPDMERMSKLIVKAAASGARIINMSLGSSDELEWAAFEEAALKHPELLFVVSAGNDGRDIDQDPVFPAALPLDNMIVVTSVADDGFPAQGSNWGRDSVDLLVPGENIATVDFSGRPADVSGSSYAVARVTALAARLLAEQPTLSASALRDQIFALADAEPGNFVRVGWIREPSDLARAADVRSIRLTAQASSAAVPLKNGLAFRPTLVMINATGWNSDRIEAIMEGAATILAQCNIVLEPGDFFHLSANETLLDFSRPNAARIADAVPRRGAAVFFVRDTLDRPGFDAVTFGTSNSRSRPALRFSVWITEMSRDPHIALAHELVHVLLDDGTHVYTSGNLMRSDTSSENVNLTEGQCALMRQRARDNDLFN
ncbi:MAG: S8 family peptidase [Arenicellales bacterium]